MQNTITLNLPATKTLKFSLTLKLFWLLIMAAIFSLFIVCVFQLNAYTREFYLINNQENRLQQLTQENKMLEINFSKANSLNNIGSYVENQAFEKVKQVEYIRVFESTVLAR